MAVTAQTESDNTENVFWVLGRVPMFTFDMNMKSFIFHVISFVCMHNHTKETLLKVSDCEQLRSIPY